MHHFSLCADFFKPAEIELMTNWTTAGSGQKTGSNVEPLVTMWRVERGNASFDKGRSRKKTSEVGATREAERHKRVSVDRTEKPWQSGSWLGSLVS